MEMLRRLLAWCSLINLAILLIWGMLLRWAHDWVYGIHAKWFGLSVERFDAYHYLGMGAFKLGIILFNLVPYLVLRFLV